MYTEIKEEKFLNLNILNRKRAKSKSHSRCKNKSKNHTKHFNIKKGKHIILPKEEEIKEQKNIENVKQNFRHFFHINWENSIFSKEAQKMGEIIDGLIYWFLINSSYFIEDNIQDYIQILKEKYCRKKAVAECDNNINNMNNNLLDNINNNQEELNTNTFNDNYKGKDINNSKSIISIMNFLNYDKKGKYFINAFGHNQGKSNLNIFKNKLKDYINIIHQINNNKIKNLEQKANFIEENYDKNNSNDNDTFIKWINDNPLLTKNNLSYSIHNNYINYLFDKEKKNLLKQDIILNNEKLNKLIEKEKQEKKEKEEDEEYTNRCYVCNDGNVNEYPYYFECEQCGLKVHANCYGIKLKHEPKRWKCDICKELSYENAVNMECVLCPNKGGAMKKINILKNAEIFQKLVNIYVNKNENLSEINTSSSSLIIQNENNNLKKIDNVWVHLSCALWNDYIKLGYIDSKLNVNITDEQIIYKYNSLCNICNKDNCGPTIKCKIDNCNFQCHPECGRIYNYFLEVEIINKTFIHNIYCHKHHPNRFAKILNNINKYKIDSIFAFDDALNKLYQLYRLKYRKEFYYPQKNDDFLIIENYINLSESNNINENSDNNNHNKKKNYRKKKNKYITNINNYHQIKVFENENQDLSEIMDEGKEIKAIILNTSNNIKNNINNLEYIIEDKNGNNSNNTIDNNNHDISKNQILDNSTKINYNNNKNENNQNIFIIENAQSKSNSSNYINLNHINYNNNISDNDMSDTTVSHIKPNFEPPFLSLEKEIEHNKESFIVYLIGFLNNYFKTNRLIVIKGDGDYHLSKNEDDNLLDEMYYDDLFSDDFPINEIQYKSLTPNLIKKYLKNIFPNEEAFNSLFINKIDSTLKKLKKNEKYKNREIICKNKENCIGSENGKYKLLNVDEFKYQILNDKNIPRFFLCSECLNNNENENENENEI